MHVPREDEKKFDIFYDTVFNILKNVLATAPINSRYIILMPGPFFSSLFFFRCQIAFLHSFLLKYYLVHAQNAILQSKWYGIN